MSDLSLARQMSRRSFVRVAFLTAGAVACQGAVAPTPGATEAPNPVNLTPTVESKPANTPSPTSVPKETTVPVFATPTREPAPKIEFTKPDTETAKELFGGINALQEDYRKNPKGKEEATVVAVDLNLLQNMAAFVEKYYKFRPFSRNVKLTANTLVEINGKIYDLLDVNDRAYAGAYLEVIIGESYKLPDDGFPFAERLSTIDQLSPVIKFGRYGTKTSLPTSRALAELGPIVVEISKQKTSLPKVWGANVANNYSQDFADYIHFDYKNPLGVLPVYYVSKPEIVARFNEKLAPHGVSQAQAKSIFFEAMTDYLTSTQDVRNEISYLRFTNDEYWANRRQAQVDFFRDLLGFETLAPGVIKRSRDVKVGDRARVWEYDSKGGKKEAITLRNDGDVTHLTAGLIHEGEEVDVIGLAPDLVVDDRRYERVEIRIYGKGNERNVVQGNSRIAKQYLVPIEVPAKS